MNNIQFVIDNAKPLRSEPDLYYVQWSRLSAYRNINDLIELGILGEAIRVPRSEYFGPEGYYITLRHVDVARAAECLTTLTEMKQQGKGLFSLSEILYHQ